MVGIDAYTHLGSDAQLQRAVSDAESVSAQLSRLDFTVTTLAANIKVDQDLFLRRFSAWTRSIEPGDFVIFYFAGHGVGISNANYLVPADMPDLTDADEYTFRAHAIAESEIRDRIKESGARVAVLMLDACRNNPFASNGRGIAFSRGLQPIEPTRGVLTIYSAGYGQTALDRLSNRDDPNPNSVFTRILLTELQKPGENLLDLSENIRERVAKLAQSVGHDQVPAVDNQLLGGRTFYLAKPEPAFEPHVTPTPEDAMWESVQASSDRTALQQYVQTFPTGRHRASVEARLSNLDDPVVPSPPLVALQPTTEDVAWRYIGANTDAAALHRFLIDYPAGRHQSEAHALLASLDDAAWQRARDSGRAGDLRDFLRNFPGSTHEGLVMARLQSLDDAAWASAAAGGRSAIERYIAAFPDARHRGEAEKRLGDVEVPGRTGPSSRIATSVRPTIAPATKRKTVKVHRVASVKPRPLSVAQESRSVPVVKTAPQTTGNRCFDVNGERYCP